MTSDTLGLIFSYTVLLLLSLGGVAVLILRRPLSKMFAEDYRRYAEQRERKTGKRPAGIERRTDPENVYRELAVWGWLLIIWGMFIATLLTIGLIFGW